MLERSTVGASFASWPDETRFITPSFATKSIGMLDLNSIASVTPSGDAYEVTAEDGRQFQTSVPPLLAGGFEGSHKLVAELFE